MIFTNEKGYGGDFKAHFLSRLKIAPSLTVATGYFGSSLVEDLESEFLAISKRGGCKILIGMVYHKGLSPKKLKTIKGLDEKLREISPTSGVYISRKEYHGKIYQLGEEIFLGSSNLSEFGFSSRWECMAKIRDEFTQKETGKYLEFLFSHITTSKLCEVDLSSRTRVKPTRPSKLLEDYRTNMFPTEPSVGHLDIPLRVDDQPASSLNLYFDKGRKNKTGLYAPRPWYEVEITTSENDRNNPHYPKSELKQGSNKSRYGEFWVHIKESNDNFCFKMVVSSDSGKAIASSKESGGRETLGRYIKGKLEAAGVLKHGDRITSDTLDSYGRDSIRLIKLNDQHYILEF